MSEQGRGADIRDGFSSFLFKRKTACDIIWDMTDEPENIELNADRIADRRTFLFICLFSLASWIILSTTKHIDGQPLLHTWIIEGSSHSAMLVSIGVVPIFMTRFPFSRAHAWRTVFTYLVGFVGFSALHICLMALFRKILVPSLLGQPDGFGLFDPAVWIYEMSKDAYTYALVLVAFYFGRHIEQLKLELDAAKSDARQHNQLRLKSGGRLIFLKVDEVLWAKAASNYVEVHTNNGAHLVRMTLSGLYGLLQEAGADHIRSHRSYVVKKSEIRELVPTGEGDAKLVLVNGDVLPASRGYREALKPQ